MIDSWNRFIGSSKRVSSSYHFSFFVVAFSISCHVHPSLFAFSPVLCRQRFVLVRDLGDLCCPDPEVIVFNLFLLSVVPKPFGSFRNRAAKLDLKTTGSGKGTSFETIESQTQQELLYSELQSRVEEVNEKRKLTAVFEVWQIGQVTWTQPRRRWWVWRWMMAF